MTASSRSGSSRPLKLIRAKELEHLDSFFALARGSMDARSSKIANERLALEIFSKDTQKTTAGSYVFGVLNSGPPETFRKPPE
jgi:hypothetical protein